MLLRCCARSAMMVCRLLIGAVAGRAQEATPAAVRVIEERVVAIEDGIPLALSPDGRWLAVEHRDRDEICVYDTATLAPGACAPVAARSIRVDSIAWSPDGRRLAFAEDLLTRADESDLWVFDLTTASVTNLTDDGYADSLLGLPAGTPIDAAPVWSPDGREIAFFRSLEEREDAWSTALYRIAVDGGEPREIVSVSDVRMAVYAGVRWLPEDGTILYSVNIPGSDPTDGLWAVGADGGQPRHLFAAADHDLDTAILGAAAGGRVLLQSPETRGVSFHLLELATGQVTALAGAEASKFPPLGATLAPDGRRVLVSHAGGLLVVRDLADGAEQTLPTLDLPIGALNYNGGLWWATNDLVFGTGPGWRGVLLWLAFD